MKSLFLTAFLVVSLTSLSASAQTNAPADPAKPAAAPATAPADKAAPDKPSDKSSSLGINADLQIATAYVFRGLNVFQKDGQMNQNMLAAPGLTWTIGETGFAVGYWGAFQLTGDNRSANTDNAINMETDFFVTYERKMTKELTLKGIVTLYTMPFADIPDISVPSWVEPGVALTYSHGIGDFGLAVSYFLGMQSELRDSSYLYVNPSFGKTFKVVGRDISAKVGYGYKQFKAGNDNMSNVHDLLFTVDTTFSFGDFYVKPALGAAWTNIEGPDSTFSDGFVVWASVNVGVNK